jgi:hypothetical protein
MNALDASENSIKKAHYDSMKGNVRNTRPRLRIGGSTSVKWPREEM